jgi:hypothetical protein
MNFFIFHIHVLIFSTNLTPKDWFLNMLQLHTYPENIIIYLFTEYVYLWELQTTSKQTTSQAGNYFQMQTTVLPSIECKKSKENDSHILVLNVDDVTSTWCRGYLHMIDTRETLARFPVWNLIGHGRNIIIISMKYFHTIS